MWHPSPHRKVAVIANGHFSYSLLSAIKEFETLVAVDGGLVHCDRLSLTPSLIIGDFDSAPIELLKKYKTSAQLEALNQNKTDLEKTLEFLMSFPLEKITVFGALGHRIDHTLTNICLLTRYPGKVIFETESESLMALEKKSHISCKKEQTLSLIPFNGPAEGITTSGLKWNLTKGRLDKNFIGISNLCLEETLEIQFDSGDLVLCLNKNIR